MCIVRPFQRAKAYSVTVKIFEFVSEWGDSRIIICMRHNTDTRPFPSFCGSYELVFRGKSASLSHVLTTFYREPFFSFMLFRWLAKNWIPPPSSLAGEKNKTLPPSSSGSVYRRRPGRAESHKIVEALLLKVLFYACTLIPPFPFYIVFFLSLLKNLQFTRSSSLQNAVVVRCSSSSPYTNYIIRNSIPFYL